MGHLEILQIFVVGPDLHRVPSTFQVITWAQDKERLGGLVLYRILY
jgi:hypothetical protein